MGISQRERIKPEPRAVLTCLHPEDRRVSLYDRKQLCSACGALYYPMDAKWQLPDPRPVARKGTPV